MHFKMAVSSDVLQTMLHSPKSFGEIMKECEDSGVPPKECKATLDEAIKTGVIQQKPLKSVNVIVYIASACSPPKELESESANSNNSESLCCIEPKHSDQYNSSINAHAKHHATAAEPGIQIVAEVESLKLKLSDTEKEIAMLAEEYSEQELQDHIKKLHEYNEVKDIGQILLGKLAEMEGLTTSHLYQRYDLTLDD